MLVVRDKMELLPLDIAVPIGLAMETIELDVV